VVAQDLGQVVVLTGVARADGRVNGAPVSFQVRFIDTYSWRDGRWQMVAWQSTRMTGADGTDKSGAAAN
jgi:hypothetical protein